MNDNQKTSNKRMQTDHPTRYASCLAADAERYNSLGIEMRIIFLVIVITTFSGCSTNFDTEAANEILIALYEARSQGDVEQQISLVSNRFTEEGKLQIKRLLERVKNVDGKLLNVNLHKTTISRKNGITYLIVTYKTEYQRRAYIESYTFDQVAGKPELISMVFE